MLQWGAAQKKVGKHWIRRSKSKFLHKYVYIYEWENAFWTRLTEIRHRRSEEGWLGPPLTSPLRCAHGSTHTAAFHYTLCQLPPLLHLYPTPLRWELKTLSDSLVILPNETKTYGHGSSLLAPLPSMSIAWCTLANVRHHMLQNTKIFTVSLFVHIYIEIWISWLDGLDEGTSKEITKSYVLIWSKTLKLKRNFLSIK